MRADKHRLQDHLNQLQGLLAEHLLAVEFRSRKRFALADYITGLPDRRTLTMVDLQEATAPKDQAFPGNEGPCANPDCYP